MNMIKYIMAYINLEQMLFEEKRITHTFLFISKNYLYFFIFEVAFDFDSDIGLTSRSLMPNFAHIYL